MIFEIRFGFGSDLDLKALPSRVAKCHRYDGYVCAKKLASCGKKFGKTKKISKIKPFLGRFVKKSRLKISVRVKDLKFCNSAAFNNLIAEMQKYKMTAKVHVV